MRLARWARVLKIPIFFVQEGVGALCEGSGRCAAVFSISDIQVYTPMSLMFFKTPKHGCSSLVSFSMVSEVGSNALKRPQNHRVHKAISEKVLSKLLYHMLFFGLNYDLHVVISVTRLTSFPMATSFSGIGCPTRNRS